MMTVAAGYGAVRGLQNRPAMPFNDRNFQPEHPTPVMYVHGINSRTAAFETRTDDYTLVNASVSLQPFGRDSKTTLLVSANNIFDVTARRHSSVLKDFAPLAGRDIRATVRVGL